MKIVNLIKDNWTIMVYLVISVFAILPFFSSGFFNIHDNTQVERVYQMSRALGDGMFPVRWVPDLGYGYGYAIFNYYSVLPYYLGGVIVLLGFSALIATKIVFGLAIISSGISMYFLVNRMFGAIPALVSAVIYLYFPYHAVNIYVRGDLAELFAYSFLPLVFYGFFFIHKSVVKNESTKKFVVIAAFSIAAVVISHNLTAFMMFIFLSLFILFSLIINKNKKTLFVNYVIVMALGFMMSAFYSVPAILEMGYSNVVSVVGGGSDWRDHFVCFGQLWNSQWGFGGSAPGCIDGMSFKLGKLNIALAIISFIAAIIFRNKLRKNKFFVFFALLSLLLSTFLVLEISTPVWALPFMDFLQFPWRFINFIGLFISIVIGFLVWIIWKQYGERLLLVFSVIIIGLTLFTNQQLFSPQMKIDEENSYYTDISHINWTVSKISDEYLPQNFAKPESESEIRNSKIEVINNTGTVEFFESRTNYLKAMITMERRDNVRVNTAYFPAWQAYLNGKKHSYTIKNDGLYIAIPEGRQTLELKYESTVVQLIANILSIVGFLLLSVVIIGKPEKIITKLYGKKT